MWSRVFGLEALGRVGEGLVIEGNRDLQTVEALSALQSIDGPLHIFGNPSLTRVDIPHLIRVAQPADDDRLAALVIAANDALVELSLPSLQVVAGDMAVENNDALAAISLPELAHVGGFLRIAYNANLPRSMPPLEVSDLLQQRSMPPEEVSDLLRPK